MSSPVPHRHRTAHPIGWRLALGVLLALGCSRTVPVSPDDRAMIASAESSMDSLRAVARAEDRWASTPDDTTGPRLGDAGARALLYLERAQLGIGSPFRLAERAASDALLPIELRRPVAWALLGRAARGEGYHVDAAALTEAPDAWRVGAITDGRELREVIDSLVTRAPSARTGEVAARIGLALARSERLVTARVADAGVVAAALSRDRRLAREDAGRLLKEAASARGTAAADSDALALLARWRRERRLASERPLLADDLRPDQVAAARLGERMLLELRRIGARSEHPVAPASYILLDSARADTAAPAVPVEVERTVGCQVSEAQLGCRAAARLAQEEAQRQMRPDPFVTITLGGFRSTITTDDALFPDSAVVANESVLVRRLAARARTADALAIEWTRLRATLPPDAPVRRRLAALVHSVALASRPFAQAPVVNHESARDVESVADALRLRTGLGRIAFDRGMPAAWRVPALRDLEGAIADLRLALPAFTLDGLAVRIGSSPKGDLALALHEPGTRTIFLPPASASGTVAHELAHDLDWQAARTQLGLRGTYATDRAARLGTEPLATAVRGLAATRTRSGRRGVDERPAELFARSTDWFVAAMLAREGRMNGVLSSVQDLDLPGFAGATAPVPGTGSADATLEALRRVTPISPSAALWFHQRFGSRAPRPALAVVQLVVGATPAWSAERMVTSLGLPVGLSDRAPSAGASGRLAATCPVEPWQRRLLWVAADARARGLLRAQAARAAVAGWNSWQARAILGVPWRTEPSLLSQDRLRDAYLRAALRELRTVAPFSDIMACD
jgi:hypothetical protein